MDADLTAQREPALRALEAAKDRLASLEPGPVDGSAQRRALLEASDAVESSIRRWLRDSEEIPIPLRLKAQSHEELRDDAVLAELRQHNLLSMEAAASIHEVFELRRRLGAGSAPEPEDERLARRAIHRLEMELRSPPPPARPTSPNNPPSEETVVHTVPSPEQPDRRRWLAGAALTALVLLLVVVAAVAMSRREDPSLAEGIALFRSGAYADAASRFWRYSEANPEDATPHLYLARIHRRLGRLDLAADEVRIALQLAPADADVQTEIGFLLLERGQYDVAVERFRSAVGADPEAASAWIGLVRALRADGRDDAADLVLARAPQRVRDLFAAPSRTSQTGIP